MKDPKGIKTYFNNQESKNRQKLLELFKKCPIPEDQIFNNLGLFLSSKDFARILFLEHIYKQVVDVQGVIMDFGTRWGQNIAIFQSLRGLYEPFNRHKKIIGFDTFKGFPVLSPKDGKSDLMKSGNTATTKDYVKYLDELMSIQEGLNPLSHIKKFELRVGDSSIEIDNYLKENPHTIIALAYFDFDIYLPTKKCLDAIKTRLVKGSILAFDELNDPDSPGETLALMESWGLNNIRLKRYPITSRTSYFVFE